MDSSFYAADVTARGFCDQGFPCEGFSPSSATVKVNRKNDAFLADPRYCTVGAALLTDTVHLSGKCSPERLTSMFSSDFLSLHFLLDRDVEISLHALVGLCRKSAQKGHVDGQAGVNDVMVTRGNQQEARMVELRGITHQLLVTRIYRFVPSWATILPAPILCPAKNKKRVCLAWTAGTLPRTS